MVANKLLTAIAVTLLIGQTINAQESEVETNTFGITRVSSRIDFLQRLVQVYIQPHWVRLEHMDF